MAGLDTTTAAAVPVVIAAQRTTSRAKISTAAPTPARLDSATARPTVRHRLCLPVLQQRRQWARRADRL
ncbi:hypothetical protein HO133_006752 [Letharia lupina]|uniref:Uncharacterized protein n=1 Tax=Letharia lupina TaxID=560253 RepID=A0A8H6C5H6_9LECA|nr:uncharacterized protein HO133_006752 [Letharia lupina]KAF6217650.1 hypothetical protein HO133_006752 [Letharia lupina]